jgi:Na+/proline symporter
MEIIKTLIHLDVRVYVYVGLFLFLVIGVLYKDKPNSIKDYALGTKAFSTPALVATMVATFIGAGNTIGYVTLFYKNGLLFALLPVCGCFAHILFARYILPQFNQYYGRLSIVSVVSKIYGNSTERFVGFIAYIYCFGVLAMQIKAIGIIIEYALGYPSVPAMIVAFMVITIYSAVGGIKSVVRTDILQFVIFIIVLPVFAFFLLNENGGMSQLSDFNVGQISGNFNLLSYVSLLILSLSPEISPIFIHRILIGRNQVQNRQIIYFWILIKIICTLFTLVVATVAISKFPGLEGNFIFFKTIDSVVQNNFFRGLFTIAMLAVVLSSADSLINTGAVIFVESLIPKDRTYKVNKVNIAKIMTLLSGLIALFIAIKAKSLLDIVFFVSEYYFTVIFIPFIGGLFIKKGRAIIFWTSSITGFLSHTLLKMLAPEIEHTSYVISLILSFIVFMLTKSLVQDRTNSKGSYIDNLECITKNIIDGMKIPISQLGYAIIPIPIFTGIIEVLGNSLTTSTTILIILAGLISVLYIFMDKIFINNQGILQNLFILVAALYSFPFLSTYIYYTLPNSNIALSNMIISVVVFGVIFSYKMFMVLLVIGSVLGSMVFVILNPVEWGVFIINVIVLFLIILYTIVILFSIFKVKEILMKKFISEFKDDTYGVNKKVIDMAINHWEARKEYLEKRASLNLDTKDNDIYAVNIEDMVKVLKNYIALIELEKKIEFSIENRIKNITITKPISMIYTIIFSVAYQITKFKEKIICMSITNRNNKMIIKYSLPNMELNVNEVRKYIRAENNPEGIMSFDLIEKIIKEQSDVNIKFAKNSIVLSIESLSKSIIDNNEKFINIYSSQNKNSKIFN